MDFRLLLNGWSAKGGVGGLQRCLVFTSVKAPHEAAERKGQHEEGAVCD